MKKLLLIIIAVIVLSGCTSYPDMEEDINDLYQIHYTLNNKVNDLVDNISHIEQEVYKDTTVLPIKVQCEQEDLQTRIQLFSRGGYTWESGGIKFIAHAEAKCISLNEVWATTPVPEQYKDLPNCN